MSRKDFKLIAETISKLSEGANGGFSHSDKSVIANTFADALKTTNSKFNRTKFLEACAK